MVNTILHMWELFVSQETFFFFFEHRSLASFFILQFNFFFQTKVYARLFTDIRGQMILKKVIIKLNSSIIKTFLIYSS